MSLDVRRRYLGTAVRSLACLSCHWLFLGPPASRYLMYHIRQSIVGLRDLPRGMFVRSYISTYLSIQFLKFLSLKTLPDNQVIMFIPMKLWLRIQFSNYLRAQMLPTRT